MNEKSEMYFLIYNVWDIDELILCFKCTLIYNFVLNIICYGKFRWWIKDYQLAILMKIHAPPIEPTRMTEMSCPVWALISPVSLRTLVVTHILLRTKNW